MPPSTASSHPAQALAADSGCGYRGKALSALQFEKHAGAKSKNQNAHIFLRNGTSLYALFHELRGVPADRLAEAFRMAAGVPMTVPAAAGASQAQARRQQPESSDRDGLQGVNVTADAEQSTSAAAVVAQEPEAVEMLTEEERAGLCLLELWGSVRPDPMLGVEGPAAEEIENVASDDLAMADVVEIKIAAGEQSRDSCLSTATPVNVQVTGTKCRTESLLEDPRVLLPVNVEVTDGSVNARVTETKYRPESILKDVRGLLSTGLLEGFRVTYKKNGVEMPGRIKGLGYSCGCSECGYTNIKNACEFEQHAGESSNNQNNHIFLDSGISLYKVILGLKFTKLYMLGDKIEKHIGLPPNLIQFEKWKASFQVGRNDLDVMALDPCAAQSSQESAPEKTSHIAVTTTSPCSLKESTSNDGSNMNWNASKRRSDRLLKRGVTEASTPTSSRSPEKGTSGLSTGSPTKNGTAAPPSTDDTIVQELPPNLNVDSKSIEPAQQKTRDNSLHPLLFKEGGLPENAFLVYKLKNGEVLKQGYKRGTGIVCDCCNKEFTPSQFEVHAGKGARRQPYRSIYTPEGLTLHEMALKLQDDLNSNGLAGANLSKICEPPSLTSSDSGEQSSTTDIIVPLKRALQERVVETESCYLCGDSRTTIGILSEHMMVFCNQCERACHVKCYNNGVTEKKTPLKVLRAYTQFRFFCCEKCKLLRASLHQGLEKFEEITFRQTKTSICWQLLSARYPRCDLQDYMHHQVIDIFKDAFAETVAEDIDVIQDMVNAKDTEGERDFRGMYCAVLTTSNTLVVSAALLKVRTEEVAELVLIATSNEFRKKGYFLLLLRLIEANLKAWNVQLLTAPVDPEMAPIWSEKLGFTILSDEEKSSLLEGHPLVMFKNLTLVQKSLA